MLTIADRLLVSELVALLYCFAVVYRMAVLFLYIIGLNKHVDIVIVLL